MDIYIICCTIHVHFIFQNSEKLQREGKLYCFECTKFIAALFTKGKLWRNLSAHELISR